MTFPSTYQSPRTVNRKAMVLTMGTVKLSSGAGVGVYPVSNWVYE